VEDEGIKMCPGEVRAALEEWERDEYQSVRSLAGVIERTSA
jgi:hypothetical protein